MLAIHRAASPSLYRETCRCVQPIAFNFRRALCVIVSEKVCSALQHRLSVVHKRADPPSSTERLLHCAKVDSVVAPGGRCMLHVRNES